MATKIVHFVSHYCGPQECDCSPRCHAREGDEIVTSSSVAAVTCKNCLRGLRKDRHPGLPQSTTIAEERDQLKAENEALRSDIQSWRLSIEAERNVHKLSMKGIQDELDRLKGLGFAEELAVLRKSAARYQWLREARSGYIEVVEWIGPHATGMTGEDLDSLLDAAMGMGGRS